MLLTWLQELVKNLGFDVADNATMDDLVAQLNALPTANTTTLGPLVSKINDACTAAGLNITADGDSLKQTFRGETSLIAM